MREAVSALTMVAKAMGKARSTEDRAVRPSRTSSLRCSKYTTLESTDTPMATIMPVTPARVRARPDWVPRWATMAHSSAPEMARLVRATRPRIR